MKAVSGSIVILTGASMFVAGAFHPHDQTQLVVCGIGVIVGVMGLVAWLTALRSRD